MNLSQPDLTVLRQAQIAGLRFAVAVTHKGRNMVEAVTVNAKAANKLAQSQTDVYEIKELLDMNGAGK